MDDPTRQKLIDACEEIKTTLLDKYDRYGMSYPIAATMMGILYPEIPYSKLKRMLCEFRICEKLARGQIEDDLDIAGLQLVLKALNDRNITR